MRGLALLSVLFASMSAAAVAPGTPGAVRGLIFDGLPPVRFQGDIGGRIVFTRDLNKYCGQPPKGNVWAGCIRGPVKDPTIYISNPCAFSGDFPKHLCHELGHMNGWTAWHEY